MKPLGENVLSFDIPFNSSDDNNFKYGRGVFYMYNPSAQEFDLDDEFLNNNVYGPIRGEIHGFASHSFKHFKEFTSQQNVNRITTAVIEKLRELRYDKVLVTKKLKGGGLNPVSDMSIDHPDFKHYIMNGLDWMQDRVQKGWNIFEDEQKVLDVAFEVHRIYGKELIKFLEESQEAQIISDANFPNKEDLFDYLEDCYMNRKAVIFEIERENGKLYQVLYNIGDTRYSSYNIEKGTRGTFMRMEKPIKRRTFWRNLIRWAPISKIDEAGVAIENGNQVTDDYNNFREICQDARFNRKGTNFELGTDKNQTPVNPKYGTKTRRKGDKATGAMIPYREDLTMETILREAIRKILLEEIENPDMVKKLNILIDAANENEATWNLSRWDRDNPYAEYPSQEWDQIEELMHSLDYIDNPPRDLKCWFITEMPDGEIINASRWLSYDDALQYAKDNGLIPADRLGNPNPDGPEENGCELYFVYEG